MNYDYLRHKAPKQNEQRNKQNQSVLYLYITGRLDERCLTNVWGGRGPKIYFSTEMVNFMSQQIDVG